VRDLCPIQQEAFAAYLMGAKVLTQRVAQRMAAGSGLSFEEYDVLVTLEYDPSHRLRMSELAERALLSRSGMTRLVDRLEAQGLVARQACPDDRRGSHCVLTEKGRQAREAAWPALREAILELFGEAVGEDAEAVARASRAIAAGAQACSARA
jgi:DNA-binding MarR family transcriptional regulator